MSPDEGLEQARNRSRWLTRIVVVVIKLFSLTIADLAFVRADMCDTVKGLRQKPYEGGPPRMYTCDTVQWI